MLDQLGTREELIAFGVILLLVGVIFGLTPLLFTLLGFALPKIVNIATDKSERERLVTSAQDRVQSRIR